MKEKLLISILLLFVCQQQSLAKKLNVLQFNVWQEGTVVKGGFDAIVDEIIEADADLVALSEVRNYNNTKFYQRVIEALAQRGETYYGGDSYDTGIISRFPIVSYEMIYPENNDHGSITKAIVQANDETQIAFYSAHLDYLNCSYYRVRGYSGTTFKEMEVPDTDLESLFKDSRTSYRDDAIKVFIKDALQESEKGLMVIIGGDFNEPSHRDWTEQTKNMFDHNGVVIEWECTALLERNGFVDTYRDKYPNPVTHPGFTYPGYNNKVKMSQLAWAPKADERERIDFIFYLPYKGLKFKNVKIVGLTQDVLRSKPVEYIGQDEIVPPIGIWPSDHKAILATFRY